MIEKPYLVHWSDDSDHNTEAVATLDEAQTEIDRWLDLRRREADDGWALDMTGCIAVIVERVVEEESEAPEWSSFDRHVDYHRERVPDPRDARVAALEEEVHSLSEALNSIKLDRESSDVTWCPQCGPHVIVDDEGLCEMCGATSVGAGSARAVALVEENAALEGRLRETCQILVESVGGLGPCNAEDAARRAAEVVDQLRAQLAAPLRLPSVEEVSARVHDAWMESKWQAGVTSRKLEGGEELMVSYPDLSEQAKELDRATVRAVYAAIGAAGRPEPAPLRLGRGPTVEEAKAHADAQEDGHGWWLVSFDVKRRPDDEAIYFEIASIEVEDGEVFVDGMSSADGSRYTEITDAIPLDASRQPCGVGVRS